MIAAAALTLLPEMLRSFNDYRMLVYAIVLIVVMLARNSTAAKNAMQRFLALKPVDQLLSRLGVKKDDEKAGESK